jgi:hypothetical protein
MCFKWYLLLKHFKEHSSKIIITSPEILKTNKDITIIQVLFKKEEKGNERSILIRNLIFIEPKEYRSYLFKLLKKLKYFNFKRTR